MNLLREVLRHEVYPSLGCTEPVSLAYAGATAAEGLQEPLSEIRFTVDPATYKNGLAVAVPNSGGARGNLIAGVLGCLIAKPGLKMQILKESTTKLVSQAGKIVREGRASICVTPEQDVYVRAEIKTKSRRATCIVSHSHTRVTFLKRDGRVLIDKCGKAKPKPEYKKLLGEASLDDLLRLAANAGSRDLAYIRKGVDMNLAASKKGLGLRRVGHYLRDLMKKGFLQDDIFSSSKILAACAADARMAGLPVAVMGSGESGNQGIVAILVPYNVGRFFRVKSGRILQSIALSHLLNAYVKVFTGSLAPICGCSIGAGVGASAAIVYQLNGADPEGIALAINNLVSDLGGMLCDGAKSGCALKVVSSAEAAIRSAYMGAHHYGITEVEGFVGRTAEETIRNLSRITKIGMARVDDTIVGIMLEKRREIS